ncbi:unnamed protein product [Candidula unifasciata]|uniref:Uncharacterized protein n=1 Tax=Candidula unifasciata TaxID=100452 RepID=A0A8S4A2N5_9EUPU|nr:unnamed protein product [Candidula unifasciata]
MVSCPVLGPKCSIYYMVISVWGIVMLALMAIFLKIRTPNLLEDVLGGNITKWEDHNFSIQYVRDQYDSSALNCGVAAILYIVLFIFAFIQLRLNNATQVTA